MAAVIGGVVGAVLVMAVGSFIPGGPQNEVKDAEFGTIRCRKIQLVDSDGIINGNMFIHEYGVSLGLFNDNAKRSVSIGVHNEYGPSIGLYDDYGDGGENTLLLGSNKYGGNIMLFGKGNNDLSLPPRAIIKVNEYGNGAVSIWDKNGDRLATLK